MSDTSSEIIKIPFAEYGKVYIPRKNPLDFEQLDMSNEPPPSSLYDLYNKLAVDGYGHPVPFTSRKPGFGNFSAALMEYPDRSGNYLYIQFHQRVEGESLWIFEGMPVGQEVPPNRNNRAFRQARFSVLPISLIMRKFQEGAWLYTSLLEREEGRPYLKTYYYQEGKGVTTKKSSPKESIYHPLTDDELDPNIVDGLTDLLVKNQSNLAVNRAVILVTSISDVETRLLLMQAAQARLLPVVGVVTFTLDFIDDHRFQFYFCTELPPDWMFTKPVIFWDSSLNSIAPNGCQSIDLKSFAQNPNGYSRSIRNIFKGNKFSDPIAGKILGTQSIPLQDRVQIAEKLISKSEPLSDNFLDLLLDNLQNLSKKDVQEIILRAFDEVGMIDSILQKASRKIPTDQVRLTLYDMIFNHAIVNLKLGLVDYYHFYRQLDKNDQAVQSLREMFLKIVRSSLPESLEKGTDNDKTFLFNELMSLGIKSELKFHDGTSIVKTILKLPGAPLFGAIKLLIEQNVWGDVFQKELVYAIIRFPEIWNPDKQNALVTATGVKLPDMFFLRVARILEDKDQLEKLEKDPQLLFTTLGQILLEKAENTQEPLLGLFTNDDIKQKLCRICLGMCIPSDMNNLRFAKMWLKELSKAEGSVFRDDYLEIITQNKNVSPLAVGKEEKEDYAIYHLLIGNPNSELSSSLLELCKTVELEDRYNTIMEIWIGQHYIIPLEDINYLVNQLPDSNSNNLLASLVVNYPQDSKQSAEICKLQCTKALEWLKKSSKNDLRKIYLNTAKEDLLYSILSGINKPNGEFAIYLLDEDPSAYTDDMSWKEYADKISKIYGQLAKHIEGESQASKFVDMVNRFSCPPGKEALHRFGLLCLAKRTVGSDGIKPFNLSIDDNKELRLILTYALGAEIDKKIADAARKILLEHCDDFLAQFPNLKDDEVYSLHFFYAGRKAIKNNVIIKFENEGWRRRGIQPPGKNGEEVSFSHQNQKNTNIAAPLNFSDQDTVKYKVDAEPRRNVSQIIDVPNDNSQRDQLEFPPAQRVKDQDIIRQKKYVESGKHVGPTINNSNDITRQNLKNNNGVPQQNYSDQNTGTQNVSKKTGKSEDQVSNDSRAFSQGFKYLILGLLISLLIVFILIAVIYLSTHFVFAAISIAIIPA